MQSRKRGFCPRRLLPSFSVVLLVVLHWSNVQLKAVLMSSRRRDFSMQTFVRPACALFFFTHCWSSDGCSNAPYAPAVQWPPPAKHWPICYGFTVQRPDTTAHCQSGTRTRACPGVHVQRYRSSNSECDGNILSFAAVSRQSSCI